MKKANLPFHINVLGWLFIVSHAIFLVVGLFVFVLLTGIGIATGESEAMFVLSIVGTIVGVVLALVAVPGIVAGYGLLARKSWARVLAVIVGILDLISFPVGTAVGVYALWTLMQDGATAYFSPLKPA